MGIQELLLITIFVSCITNIVMFYRIDKVGTKGWIYTSAVCAMFCVTLWTLYKKEALVPAFSIYMVLIILPSYLSQIQTKLLAQKKYKRATILGYLIYYLHPFDGFHIKKYSSAIDRLIENNDFENTKHLTENIADFTTSLGRQLHFKATVLNLEYKKYIERIETEHANLLQQALPDLVVTYGRAAFELQDFDRILKLLNKKIRIKSSKQYLILFLYTLAGEVSEVENLFETSMKAEQDWFKKFMIARAYRSNGFNDEFVKRVEQINKEDLSISEKKQLEGINNKIYTPLTTDQKKRVIREVKSFIEKEKRYSIIESKMTRTHLATRALLITISIAYIFQMYILKKFSIEAIDSLGTMHPAKVLSGEYGRVFQYMFLHGNLMHFLVNLYSIFFLCPFIENSFGKKKTLTIFFSTGMLAGISITLLSLTQFIDGDMRVVGASAGIMGLLGAAVVFGFRGWKTFGSKKGRNLTSALIAIFISQSIIDISVPEISFAGHFFGFFWGVIISYGLYPKQNTQEQHVKEPLKKTDNEQKAS